MAVSIDGYPEGCSVILAYIVTRDISRRGRDIGIRPICESEQLFSGEMDAYHPEQCRPLALQ